MYRSKGRLVVDVDVRRKQQHGRFTAPVGHVPTSNALPKKEELT
jgi:hypothetical protein